MGRTASAEFSQQHLDIISKVALGGLDNVEDVYPLSPLQEGMLFHRLLNEKVDAYVLSTLFELRSRAQVPVLAQALQKIIDRHEVLRTAVIWEGIPRPIQVVHRTATLPVSELTSAGGSPAADQIKEYMKPVSGEIDLGRAPLLRLDVIADPSGTVYAVLKVHHMVCDHQSLRAIVSETMAILAGHEHSLPVPVPFKTHVLRGLARANRTDAQAFFRKRLEGIEEPTAPFGLVEGHGDASQIHESLKRLDEPLSRRVREAAARYAVSPARIFHAAWGLVVACTSGRSDVVLGTVIATGQRGNARPPGMLGMSVNTLPLRMRLRGVTVEELIHLVHRELQDLLQHGDSSLADVQRCSAVDAGPLFTAILNVRRGGAVESDASVAADVRVLERGEAWTNYPITMTVDEVGATYLLMAHTDRRIDAGRMNEYFQTAIESLVGAITHAPHKLALSLPVLPPNEYRLVIEVLNATAAPLGRDVLVHELFEAQVRRAPGRIAIQFEGELLSYAEVNRKANMLARYLRSNGVTADTLVGVCIERSSRMILAVLGILKAAAAYLPLDPSYPVERLEYMLRDARPHLVLVDESLPTQAIPGVRILNVEEVLAQLDGYAADNLVANDLGLTQQSIVYTIYTSGSTGLPKGTAMAHGAMVNLVEWHRSALPLNEGERVLQFAPLSFDVAFQEIFSTLCLGGTLVLVDEWTRRDARALCGYLSEQRVSRLFAPPLMLQAIAEYSCDRQAIPEMLKDVITAGEQLRISPEIVKLFHRLPECRLHNHYGPTETHVVTALTLSPNAEEWASLPSIGGPIANTQMYILDELRKPVPVGVVGEIYIGGANIARGYLNRPELTAERFVSSPFGVDPSRRVYRTGDIGRRYADGSIEYLGRNDAQVKIRGYRIEPREIEAYVARNAQVRDAIVVPRVSAHGDKHLVAYVTGRNGSRPAAESLRDHLRELVPEHMVPSAFVVLDAMPTTPSGKVDYRALPPVELDELASLTNEPPSGATEEAIASIWQELLQVRSVGRDDNFFHLGGHSILAMRAASRIGDVLATAITIRSLFENPTLRAVAAHVDSLKRVQLFQSVADEDMDADQLLDALSSMPESDVRQLLDALEVK